MTNANVNTAIATNPAATRSALQLYSYETIWFEEADAIDLTLGTAGLAIGGYEWSLGNGRNTLAGSGWLNLLASAEVVAIGLHIHAGNVTVELVKNSTPTGITISASGSLGQGINDSMVAVSLNKGDVVNFRTTAASGNAAAQTNGQGGGCVFALVRRPL